MDPLEAELNAATARAWDAFGRERLSRQFEVCTCAVCMSDDDRALMIATPVAEMPPRLIREYSNSAHVLPANRGDLRALLPRYLELIAAGEIAHDLCMGLELARFGEAIAADPHFLAAEEAQAYADWSRALLKVWPVGPYWSLSDAALVRPATMLIAGGIPMSEIAGTLDSLLDDDTRLNSFVETILWEASPTGVIDNISLDHAPVAEARAFVNWLKAPRMANRLDAFATDPATPANGTEWARILRAILPDLCLSTLDRDK